MVLLLAACVSVFTTAGIVYILVKESLVFFFGSVPLWTFLTDTQWTPLFDDAHFGIMVLLSGTVTSSAGRAVRRIPLGTIIAIYLSEFAGHKTRETLKPCSSCCRACRPSSTATSRCCSSPRCCRRSSPSCPASTCCRPAW
jgi:ABC-type phosphate transport system permease subunit